MKSKILYETETHKIHVCGLCDEVFKENKITNHLKKIHNIDHPKVSNIITKVVMI